MQFNSREDIIQMTPLWTGERLPDGRPLVPAQTLERIRNMSLEEVWQVCYEKGYDFLFQSGFIFSNPSGKPTVGRAVTSTFMPIREDLEIAMKRQLKAQGAKASYNMWVCDSLIEDDVWVTDFFDKIKYGTIIGGNLGTVIAKKTKRGGAVVWGGMRDLDQLRTITDVNFYFRGIDPTPIRDHVMTGFNSPTRIGEAICLPGDVVYACESGVYFIPPHLAEEVAMEGEKTKVKDIFGFQRVREGRYDASAIDSFPWTMEMIEDFLDWLVSDDKAVPYRHLTWEADIEESRSGVRRFKRHSTGTQSKQLHEV